MAMLWVNGAEAPPPSKFVWGLIDVSDSNSGRTQDTIMQLLTKDKHEYILRCKYCGRILQVDSPFRVCSDCRRDTGELHSVHPHRRRRR